ncbi:MAG: hypothetical protein WA751_00650 [Candidatus Dormiibacterota bacterium]
MLSTKTVTKIALISDLWYGVGLIGPPLTTSCQAGGKEVTIRGAFGPETAQVQLRGLRPGKHYTILGYGPPVSATVRVTETGPVVPQLIAKGSTDFLGPAGGLEAYGNGTLSVAADGRSGSLQVTLPKGDSISGHWRCGSSRTTGPPNRPALTPARVRPAVDECSLGSSTSSPPPVVTCPNGDLNIEAWTGRGYVEAAGRKATLGTVEADLCRDQVDFAPTTPPFLATAFLENEYSVAAVYYGWKFNLTPAALVAGANCSS